MYNLAFSSLVAGYSVGDIAFPDMEAVNRVHLIVVAASSTRPGHKLQRLLSNEATTPIYQIRDLYPT